MDEGAVTDVDYPRWISANTIVHTFCCCGSKEGQALLCQGEDTLQIQIDDFRESGVLERWSIIMNGNDKGIKLPNIDQWALPRRRLHC